MTKLMEKTPGGPPASMGKYVPFARLGNGGMADVYLAVASGPVGFNKLVVIKRMRNPEDAEFVRMFLDEARVSARLNHPNIVHTYEVGEAEGQYFLAMEYLDGQPLDRIARAAERASRPLGDAMIAYVIAQALKGLHYAHEMADYDGTPLGIVHRDCSPQNLFVSYSGQIKVLDFGIAKAAMNASHTETGVLKGKARYMSPEQLSLESIDRRADIYAMGIVLWELLARRRLFEGDAMAVMMRVATEAAPSIRTIRPEVNATLDGIVAKALERDPAVRYATAEAMQHDLERYLKREEPSVTESELGALVGSLFAETRDDVRARIKTHLATAPAVDPNAPSGLAFDSEAAILPVLVEPSNESSSNKRQRIELRTGTGAGVLVSGDSHAPPAARTRTALYVGVALAMGALLVGGGALMRGKTPPAAAATSAPPPSAEPVVPHIRARIVSDPPGALIEWRGRPLDRTPAIVDLPGDAQTLYVSREGYTIQSLTLTPSVDGGLDERTVKLVATPAPTVAPPPQRAEGSGRQGGSPSSGSTPRAKASPPPATPSAAPPPKLNFHMIDDKEPSNR